MKVIGSLCDWQCTDILEISVETLLIYGEYDRVRLEAIRPWLEKIKNAKVFRFQKSSNLPVWEEPIRHRMECGAFLDSWKAKRELDDHDRHDDSNESDRAADYDDHDDHDDRNDSDHLADLAEIESEGNRDSCMMQ